MSSRVERAIKTLQEVLDLRRGELKEALVRRDVREARRILTQISDEVYAQVGVRLVLNLIHARGFVDEPLGHLAFIYDLSKKRFKEGQVDIIKEMALRTFPGSSFAPFISRERDGIHVYLEGGRIDVLAGAVYVWTKLDDQVVRFLELLESNIFNN